MLKAHSEGVVVKNESHTPAVGRHASQKFCSMQPELVSQSWTLANTPPLWPLEFFCVALNQEMPKLIDDCDAGIFGRVWHIGVNPAAPKTRRELRVFYRDGLALLQRRPLPELTYEQAVDEFLPKTRGVRGTELQKFFCCGVDLIHDLDAAGLLQVEREGLAVSGPRASKLYTRASVLNFLRIRALVRDTHLN